MDWTHTETWFTFTWYNRRQDEGKRYKRKETATNAKWCNQQVLWRFKERGWRQKLVEEKGVINLPSKADNQREREYAEPNQTFTGCIYKYILCGKRPLNPAQWITQHSMRYIVLQLTYLLTHRERGVLEDMTLAKHNSSRPWPWPQRSNPRRYTLWVQANCYNSQSKMPDAKCNAGQCCHLANTFKLWRWKFQIRFKLIAIQGHQTWCQSKAHMQLPICWK